MNTQAISLDVSKEPAITPVLYLGQGDKNGTIIEATIYDNGVPLTLTNYSVRFEMRLPDHTSYYRSPNGTVSGNVATIPIDETYAASVDGQTCIAYVVVFSGSNTICSTNRINIIVLESAEEGADAAHAYESGIIAATEAANAAAQSANDAAASASTAATSATTAADNASTQATAAQNAASAANSAASNANQQAAAAQRNADAASTAATAATSAAENANDATTRANAAIDAMGDISELAVPLMTKDTRGGAKLGNSVQLENERLNVKLTASGSGRSVATESAEALQSLTVHGESIQDGKPTPDAPVEVQVVEGRNLLENTATTTTVSGVTFTVNEDKSITANGTATAAVAFPISVVNIPDGNYMLSGCPANGSASTYRLLLAYHGYEYGAGLAITGPVVNRAMTIVIANGYTCENLTFRPQLEKGTTVTPYTPYGSIGLKVGSTITPIDLQGYALASQRDGTYDRLLVDSAGHKMIDARIGAITLDGSSDEGWTVTNGRVYGTSNIISNLVSKPPSTENAIIALSDKMVAVAANPNVTRPNITNSVGFAVGTSNGNLFLNLTNEVITLEQLTAALAANPITIYYPLATPQLIDLGYIDMPTIESGDAISVSATITPVIDATWWERGAGAVADAIKAIMAALEARTGELAEAIADITNG